MTDTPMSFGLPALGEEQNLLLSPSKHLYATKDGTLRWQKKPLDPRLPGKQHVLRLVLFDVGSGTMYGECHPLATFNDVVGFLARAWHPKREHPMRGLPTRLCVARSTVEHAIFGPDLQQLASLGGFKLATLPSGFPAGAQAVRAYEDEIASLFWRCPEGLTPDLEMTQLMAAPLSFAASSALSHWFDERWRDRAAPPDAFFTHIDGLYVVRGAWRLAHFAIVLDGLPPDAAKTATAPAGPAPHSPAALTPGSSPDRVRQLIQAGYRFELRREAEEMPTRYSERTGEPTRYDMVHEAFLRFRRPSDKNRTEREDDWLRKDLDLDTLERAGGFAILNQPQRRECAKCVRESLQRAPLNINGYNLLAEVLSVLRQYDEALAVSTPVVSALLELLPTDRKVQVSYGIWDHRPFFHLLHVHLLALHGAGQHPEANRIAKTALQLCPYDNIGFRYLTTRAARDADSGFE